MRRAAAHPPLVACAWSCPWGWARALRPARPPSRRRTRLTGRILALEDSGRARPFEAAQALEALLPATAAHGTQRLELLTVQGLVLAAAAPSETIEPAATRLEAWAGEPTAPNAAAAGSAAQLVRARAVARSGNLQRADAMMQDADGARCPRRCCRASASATSSPTATSRTTPASSKTAVRLDHEALKLADALGAPWRRAEARSALGLQLLRRQAARTRARLADEAMAIAEQAGDPVTLAAR